MRALGILRLWAAAPRCIGFFEPVAAKTVGGDGVYEISLSRTVRPPSSADCTNAAIIAMTSTDQAMGMGGLPLTAIWITRARVST